MREISIVLSNIYICNKICKRDAKKQMREGDTILKINVTSQCKTENIALLSVNKISKPQTTYNNLKHYIIIIVNFP